ncbi:hypothetical protein [Clostridium sp. JS66]|uniref:hypothetical protein n=1 Tax=Clostridium sp. JS66 TaxID=3064705 RepID=UPI00298E81BF|nr:hypothetical protein [Clostridium sp. JS66]WPC41078.1 hypothetical protein Q6H37_24785 [Clostridium sp. JS66]
MEFRLNKIDPEVRQRVKETTSSGKIHNKSSISISKDNKDKKNGNRNNFASELEKEKKKKEKKVLSVDAVKFEEVEVPVYKEEQEEQLADELSGHILDVRK